MQSLFCLLYCISYGTIYYHIGKLIMHTGRTEETGAMSKSMNGRGTSKQSFGLSMKSGKKELLKINNPLLYAQFTHDIKNS